MKSLHFSTLCFICILYISLFIGDDNFVASARGKNGGRGERKKQKNFQTHSPSQLLPPPPPPLLPEPRYLSESHHQSGGYIDHDDHEDHQVHDDFFSNNHHHLSEDEKHLLSGESFELTGSGGGGSSSDSGSGAASHQCEEIQIEVCQGIGYNVTIMPNLVGQESQIDAKSQLHTFVPLISYGCSSQLKFFLCSVYAPMCTEKVKVTIGPCRPLCESVRNRCEPVLKDLGFKWPEALNCSKFVPENTVDHMCMEGPPPDENEQGMPPEMPSHTHNNYLPNHTTDQHFVPSNLGRSSHIHPNTFDSTKPHSTNINPYYPQPETPHLPGCQKFYHSEEYIFLENHPTGPHCVPRCGANILFSNENKRFVDYWTGWWAAISVICCTFTLLIFGCSAKDKFHYPERAIVYIAACYLLYGMAYLYRVLVGRNSISCHQEVTTGVSVMVQEAEYNPHCTLSFLMLYYFGMAGAAWWVNMCTTWSLALAFRWTPAELSNRRQLYHWFAWLIPALQTITAIVTHTVDGDELTGTCSVGNQNANTLFKFIILPLTLYLSVGLFIIVASLIFVRFVHVHLNEVEIEACAECCPQFARSSINQTSTEMFIKPDNSSIINGNGNDKHSPALSNGQASPNTATAGCGDFCRRIRSGSGSVLRNAQAQTGSGQSLLLPLSQSQQQQQTTTVVGHFSSAGSTHSSQSSHSHHNHHHHHHPQAPFPHLPSPPHKMTNGTGVAPNSIRSSSTSSSSTTTANGGRRSMIGGGGGGGVVAANNHHNQKRNRRLYRAHLHSYSYRATTFRRTLFYPHQYMTPEDETTEVEPLFRAGVYLLLYIVPAISILFVYLYEYFYRNTWLLLSTQEFATVANETMTSSSASAIGHGAMVAPPNNVRLISMASISTTTVSSIINSNIINPTNNLVEASAVAQETLQHRPNLEIFNLRLFLSLVLGINTAVWIIIVKNPINTWRCIFWQCLMKKIVMPHLEHTGGGGGGIGCSALNPSNQIMNHCFQLDQQQQTIASGRSNNVAGSLLATTTTRQKAQQAALHQRPLLPLNHHHQQQQQTNVVAQQMNDFLNIRQQQQLTTGAITTEFGVPFHHHHHHHTDMLNVEQFQQLQLQASKHIHHYQPSPPPLPAAQYHTDVPLQYNNNKQSQQPFHQLQLPTTQALMQTHETQLPSHYNQHHHNGSSHRHHLHHQQHQQPPQTIITDQTVIDPFFVGPFYPNNSVGSTATTTTTVSSKGSKNNVVLPFLTNINPAATTTTTTKSNDHSNDSLDGFVDDTICSDDDDGGSSIDGFVVGSLENSGSHWSSKYVATQPSAAAVGSNHRGTTGNETAV